MMGVGGRERTHCMMGGRREGEDTLHDGGWEGGREKTPYMMGGGREGGRGHPT